MFDTLAFAERLKEGGFDERQARAVTEAFVQASGDQLATKSDLDAVERAMKSDLDAVERAMKSDLDAVERAMKSDLDAVESALKLEISELRSELRQEIKDFRAEVFKWGAGLLVAQTAVLVTVVRLL